MTVRFSADFNGFEQRGADVDFSMLALFLSIMSVRRGFDENILGKVAL